MLPVRKNVRVSWHDYGAGSWYFVTICCLDQACLFGSIKDRTLHPSPIGKIVDEQWQNTFNIRNDLRPGCYVIMPNHFHALFAIEEIIGNERPSYVKNVIGGFKGLVTQKAQALGSAKIWQRNYHEHIVRTEEDWNRIADYIYKNPEVWEQDRFFKANGY